MTRGTGVFLRGNGQYTAAVLQEGWYAVLDEAHERLNRGQAGIAGTGTVPAYGFTLGQKLHHEGSIKLLKAERRRPEVQSLAGEREQQLEGIRITGAGMHTGPPLEGQTLP